MLGEDIAIIYFLDYPFILFTDERVLKEWIITQSLPGWRYCKLYQSIYRVILI